MCGVQSSPTHFYELSLVDHVGQLAYSSTNACMGQLQIAHTERRSAFDQIYFPELHRLGRGRIKRLVDFLDVLGRWKLPFWLNGARLPLVNFTRPHSS